MKAYLSNLGWAATRLLNALTGGDPKVGSFSARAGLAKHEGKVWGVIAAALVDALLRSHNHCEEQAREDGLLERPQP